jgi:hypothetical protein
LGNKNQTPPVSKAPETGSVDDSWDDLVFSALGERPHPEEEQEEPPRDIFDRATAVPDSPPEGDAPAREPRTRTAPELSVDRMLARVEAGRDISPANVLSRRRTEDALELDLGDRSTPLDLAGVHGRPGDSGPTYAATGPGATPSEPSREPGTRNDMQDRYAVGDFTGALVVAESILDSDPDNEDAKRYAQSCREVLTQMYAARLGPMDQVPSVVVPSDQITWLSLDHRAGFLLSLVDGISNIEEILDISGMTRLDALRIMYTLAQQNVIALSR